jgi:SAM-dependent methyltransferase
MGEPTNPLERRRWNDEHWTSVWPKRERFTDSVTPLLLDTTALAPGERVLDVGCGGGKTTIEAGRRVGRQGLVAGADLSEPLIALARSRIGEAGVTNVSFHAVDMQHDHVDGGPFDVAFSQFGVMFFDEPVTAFTNIAAHLREGGRIAFACWRAPDRNPWMPAFALGQFLSPPPPPAPGKAPTGPFALADADRTAGILRDAGFSNVRRSDVDTTVDAPQDAIVDDRQLAFMGVTEADMDGARRAVNEHMAQFRIDTELCRFPLSFQIFEAQRP